MPVVVVANPKGGVGKSTLSTNIAGYFASQGHPVILGDTDRQESAKLWLGLRPAAARPIGLWDGISSDVINVYHVRDAVPLQFNQIIMAGAVLASVRLVSSSTSEKGSISMRW